LRIVIGFLQVSRAQQLALTRHGKAFESLAPEEKKTLQNDLIVSVFALARQVDEPFRRGY